MQSVLTMLVAGLVGLAGFGSVRADDVTIDKLPKPVVDALKKRFPKGELSAASKEGEKEKTTYEVTVKEGTLKADVNLNSDGVITGIEKQIAEKDLPKAIAAAWKGKYSNGTFKTCEEVISVKDGKETLEYYEVVVETPDKKTVELEIEKDGKVKKVNSK